MSTQWTSAKVNQEQYRERARTFIKLTHKSDRDALALFERYKPDAEIIYHKDGSVTYRIRGKAAERKPLRDFINCLQGNPPTPPAKKKEEQLELPGVDKKVKAATQPPVLKVHGEKPHANPNSVLEVLARTIRTSVASELLPVYKELDAVRRALVGIQRQFERFNKDMQRVVGDGKES
jgi:hypothetical protein